MVRFSRVQMMLGLGVAVIALGMAHVPHASAQPMPIAATGWNQNVVVDQARVGIDVTHSVVSFDGGPIAWFEAGAPDEDGVTHADGLPTGGFTSQLPSAAVYQFQPFDGTSPNVLRIGRGETQTLTLVTPASFSQLAVIGSSGSAFGGQKGTLQVNYDDGSNSGPIIYNADDWCDIPARHVNAAISDLGRANIGDPDGGFLFVYLSECAGGANHDFALYETLIPTDPAKNVMSVDFIDTAGGGDATFTGIFAISGQ